MQNKPGKIIHKIFISYSHKDEALKDQVLVHLNALESKVGPDVWSDDKIELGDKWLAEIETALQSARIAILLVSKNFLTSNFIKEIELHEILERFGKGKISQADRTAPPFEGAQGGTDDDISPDELLAQAENTSTMRRRACGKLERKRQESIWRRRRR
ncbi:MAG: toll/interleukin-1 receptor domain-containing protein [bacterium]